MCLDVMVQKPINPQNKKKSLVDHVGAEQIRYIIYQGILRHSVTNILNYVKIIFLILFWIQFYLDKIMTFSSISKFWGS